MGKPTVPNYHGLHLLRRLRELREAAGLRQEDVADQAHMTLQKVSRIESGQIPGYHELRAFLAIYQLPETDWTPYLDLWEEAKKPRWWRRYRIHDDPYIPWEDVAATKYEFQLGQLPTLLQTQGYARATLATNPTITSDTLDAQVAALMRQQDRLFNDHPLHLHALVHLPALRRGVDNAQLHHLITCAQLPNITLQIVPQHDAVYTAFISSLILLTFNDPHQPDIAFTPTHTGLTQTQDPQHITTVNHTLNHLASLAMDTETSLDLIKQMSGNYP